MGRNKISRREFLYAGAAAAVGTALAACQPQTIVIETQKEVTKVVTQEKVVKETVVVEKEKQVTTVVKETVVVEKEKEVTATPVPPANEAPALSRMVQAGQIPPLDERLPSNPFVIEGLDGIGKYGGLWRMGKSGQADGYSAGQVTERGLTKYNQDLELVNYLCDSWEVSPDATTWTYNIRKGVKWSDGEPHTSEDWSFWWNDLTLNTEYTSAVSTAWVSFVDGERVPAAFDAVDAFTIRFTFAQPKALFTYTGGIVRSYAAVPMHFLKQFHPAYAPKADLDAAVAAAGLDDWTQLLGNENNSNMTQERPMVAEPWIELNDWTNEMIFFERNPYFWEIDTAGNQLPYIDRLQFRSFTDPEIYVMWMVNGEIDCQSRHAGGWDRYTVLKENEATGDYFVQLWRATRVYCMHFNMTTKNERLRELFSERDFRIAMSYAVNRDEMRDLLMDGNATNMQYSPPADSPYYYPKLANAYLEYDVDKANELLDGLGYTEKNNDGMRLFKDGSGDPISITVISGVGAENAADLLLLSDYFKGVGLQLNIRGMDRSLSIEMHNSNEVEMTAGEADRNLIPLADPQVWTKHTNIDDRPWANAYTAWYMDPTLPIAEEPPAGHFIWDIWKAWEEIQQTADEEKQKELFWQILDIWSVELPSVGLYGDIPRLVPTKNGLKGIHAGYGWDCCTTSYEHIIDNATWYWDEPEMHA
jgi:peptide/nickel transport system substrate-binding protein